MKLLVALVLAVVTEATPADYAAARQRFVEYEMDLGAGADLVLSPAECAVNDALLAAKTRELQAGLRDLAAFPPALHFFKVSIDETDAVEGALLHGHDTGMVSTDYVVNNITYRDHLYSCLDAEGQLLLRFFPPAHTDTSCAWKEVAEMRRQQGVNQTDCFLRSHLTLFVDNPEDEYPDITAAWTKFSELFLAISGMVTYRPVFEDYYYQTLLECLEDGVIYIELRGILPDLYDLDGRTYSGVEVLDIYKNVTERFKADHRSFMGARFIYAPVRRVNDTVMDGYVELALALHRAHPDFLLGFDLVGQEDLGRPLKEFVRQLLRLARHMPFFFHAGETNWQGLMDENLVDAVLLNTRRIGHGFALPKHPAVLQLVRRRGIAIEVNPISNQVLKLVADLRNHPCSMLLAQDYPVVIAPDDPSFWGAKGVSYDLYLAFMGMAPAQADLHLLKQLALNSIRYSGLCARDKHLLEKAWQHQWLQFIASMAANRSELSVELLTD